MDEILIAQSFKDKLAITDSYVTMIKHIYTREMLEIEKWITDQSIAAEITLPCLPGMREGPGQGAHSAAFSAQWLNYGIFKNAIEANMNK